MHTATVVPCTTTTQVAPEVGEAAEDKQPASESGSAGSRSTVASSDTTSAGTEPFPVTKGASTKEKKKRARRAALQLAPVLIAALEEEEEPSRAHVATTQHNVTKAGELNDTSIERTATTDLTHSDTDYVSSAQMPIVTVTVRCIGAFTARITNGQN
ncbi:hypothetical protein DVH05_025266 [Phytophthora capsici]|nr:hypothetical protein DVH05_025266 [Phytophthora capsici]